MIHQDKSILINPLQIRKDQEDVQRILSTIAETFIEPVSQRPLISISAGFIATDNTKMYQSRMLKGGQIILNQIIQTATIKQFWLISSIE